MIGGTFAAFALILALGPMALSNKANAPASIIIPVDDFVGFGGQVLDAASRLV
jgi:hypothetical protein